MTQDGETTPVFDLDAFQEQLEQKVAQMCLNASQRADYNFALDVRTTSNHPRHLQDSFILVHQTQMQAYGPYKVSQNRFLIGEVNFWDTTDYRRMIFEQEYPDTTTKKPSSSQTRGRPPQCIGKRDETGKLFIIKEESILCVLANILAFTKPFEAQKYSIRISDLDYFSRLNHTRKRGHLTLFEQAFERIPSAYHRTFPPLPPTQDPIERLVAHVKPTIKYNPIEPR